MNYLLFWFIYILSSASLYILFKYIICLFLSIRFKNRTTYNYFKAVISIAVLIMFAVLVDVLIKHVKT